MTTESASPPTSAPAGKPAGIPAVFLDRDGVVNVDVGFPHLEEHLEFMPGAAKAIQLLNRQGYLVVIVTNQSGVARGLFSEAQMKAFNALIVRRLGAKGALIGAVYACPWHHEAQDPAWFHEDHPDRKPNPGMLLRAIADHNIDPARSFMIGDRESDMEAARRAGVKGFLFHGPDLADFVHDVLGL